jgi:hypothetical protein
MEPTTTITKLQITTHKDGVPNRIFAVFSDGRHLTLDYQRTWRQCFATLSGNGNRLYEDAEFLRHIRAFKSSGAWDTVTTKDWANVCFAYRMEMEESQ